MTLAPRRFGRIPCALAMVGLSLALCGDADAGLVMRNLTRTSATLTAAPHSTPNNLGSFQININPVLGGLLESNAAALAAFQRAAQQWEAFISDPITVDIKADLAALPSGVLGSASSTVLIGSYGLIRNQMVTDAGDEADDGIVASLPAGSMAFNMPSGFGQLVSSGLPQISLSKANAKALGFGGLPAGPDADITFTTTLGINFDFDNSDGVTPGFYDFESVAAHEIGHALGFFSDVDFIDFVKFNGGLNNGTSSAVTPTTLDMFRFANNVAGADPATAGDFGTFSRSLIPGQNAIFDQVTPAYGSIEMLMSTGVTQGDGRQGSHFKDSLGIGLMDPTLAPGEIGVISLNDLRTLDLIGYEITAVPEAGAFLFGAVALCLGAGWRLRRGAAV